MAQPLGPILDQADSYFMHRSRLHEAARELAAIFDREGIPYAVAGALALAVHGRVRLTEDIDILVRREDLAAFKQRWLGRGYVEITPGLKAVRDVVRDVKINFLLTGDYPGDGRPKPVAFPDPAVRSQSTEGFRIVTLEALIELKLASGMTAPQRGQDLVDVVELIRARQLQPTYAEQLDPYVRPKFLELWQLAQIRDDY